jgi:DNA-binding NarL/FixJ family response regulator
MVLFLDPQPVTVGTGARFLRSAGASFEVVRIESLGAMNTLSTVRLVDLAVFNIGAASVCDIGIAQEIGELRVRLDEKPIMLLAPAVRMSDVQCALRLGVRGFMPASLSAADILAGLRIVLAGGIFVPVGPGDADAAFAESVQEPSSPFDQTIEAVDASTAISLQLTFREDEVLRGLRAGWTNRQIAQELRMADGTVKVHVRNILRKLKATNRIQAVEIADRELMSAAAVPEAAPAPE